MDERANMRTGILFGVVLAVLAGNSLHVRGQEPPRRSPDAGPLLIHQGAVVFICDWSERVNKHSQALRDELTKVIGALPSDSQFAFVLAGSSEPPAATKFGIATPENK